VKVGISLENLDGIRLLIKIKVERKIKLFRDKRGNKTTIIGKY